MTKRFSARLSVMGGALAVGDRVRDQRPGGQSHREARVTSVRGRYIDIEYPDGMVGTGVDRDDLVKMDAITVGQRVVVTEGEDAGSEGRVVSVSAGRIIVELPDGANLSTRPSAVRAK